MVKMYRQPMQTSNPNGNHQTFCSALIYKIGKTFNKNASENPPDEDQKKNTASSSVDKDGKQNKNEIERVVKKLKKLADVLPLALQYSDAFGPGETHCDTCSMTKESYKKEIYHSRIVDKLVDGIIEKEQSESIDSKRSSVDSKTGKPNGKMPNEKGDKYTLTFGIYCQGDPVKHNLKCILINLQQTIRDIMVQISFVKSRNLGNEERYKPFDISVSNFKFLKYEYSNLIDIIISLFSKPTKKSGEQVCVTCVKQKLLIYNDLLNDVLSKHGRDLKIVMRNENMDKGEGQCCSRDYPHVHAEVQGKPIVLKYSLPMQIKSETPNQEQNPVLTQNVENSKDNAFPNGSYDENWTRPEKEPIITMSSPYDEWPPEYQETLPTETSLPVAVPLSADEEPTTRPSPEQDFLPDSKISKSPSKTSLTTWKSHGSQASNVPSTGANLEDAKSLSNISPAQSSSANHPSLVSPTAGGSFSTQTSKVPSTAANIEATKSPSNISPAQSSSANNPFLKPATTGGSLSSQTSAPPTLTSGSKDNVSNTIPPQIVKRNHPSRSSESSLSSLTKEKSIGSQSSSLPTKEEAAKSPLNVPSSQPTSSQSGPKEVAEATTPSSKEPEQPKIKLLNKSENPNSENDASSAGTIHEPSDALKANEKPNLKDFSSDYSTSSSEASYQSFDPRDARNSSKKVFFNDEVDKTVLQVATNQPYMGFPNPKNNVNTPQDFKECNEDIIHQNKDVEDVLRQLGKYSLMKVSQPADCCQTNSFLSKEGTNPNLPLCASLYSLPLDKSDLEYIAKTSGKPISSDEIRLESMEDRPVKEYDWEIPQQYDPNNTRWLQAINEPQQSTSKACQSPGTQLNCVESPTKKRKMSPKYSVLIKRLPFEELPSISENDPPSEEGTPTYLPFMPSVPSLPLDDSIPVKSKKRKKPSINKNCEIRYFTIELTGQASLEKSPEQNSDDSGNATTQSGFKGCETKKREQTFCNKIPNSSKHIKHNTSCESFHSCYSSESEISYEDDNVSKEPMQVLNEERPNKTIEELTMSNVIHLCDKEFENKEVNLLWNPPCFKSSSSILQIHDFFKLPCKQQHFKDIDDNYVKQLVSHDEPLKMEGTNKKKSYTIVNDVQIHIKSQNEIKGGFTKKTKIATNTQEDCGTSYANKRSYTILSGPMLKSNDKSKHLERDPFKLTKNNSLNRSSQKLSICHKQKIKELINEIPKESELKENRRQITHHINKESTRKKEKRKPLLLANPKVKYIRGECRVNIILLTYPTLFLVEDKLEIPQIFYTGNNIVPSMIDISKAAPVEDEQSYGPLIKKTSKDQSNFGFTKQYISVKDNPDLVLGSNISLENSFTHQNGLKDRIDLEAEPSKSFYSIISEKENHNEGQNQILQTISEIMQIASNSVLQENSDLKTTLLTKKDEFVLIDEHCKPLRLFNTNGRPLTDNSGRPLKTVCGKLLLMFDEEGIPLSDWENNPVCDSLGKFMDDADFNSETPWDSEILRSFTTDCGDPKVFYDVEGMPLTSVSGTMLVNASGVGLIRVNVAGKPVSDLRGRPLYDSSHKQC